MVYEDASWYAVLVSVVEEWAGKSFSDRESCGNLHARLVMVIEEAVWAMEYRPRLGQTIHCLDSTAHSLK